MIKIPDKETIHHEPNVELGWYNAIILSFVDNQKVQSSCMKDSD